MRHFADDLFAWAHGIFKKLPRKQDMDIHKLAVAIGSMLDDAKLAIFRPREIRYILTSSGRALDLHGVDRKLPRLAGETDADYRLRLLTAYDIYRMGGTEIGMKSVLAGLGYADATLYPLWREKYKWSDDPTPIPLTPDANPEYLGKWSQFVISLNVTDREVTATQRAIFRDTVNRAKPVESKLFRLLNVIHVDENVPYRVLSDGMVILMSAAITLVPSLSTSPSLRVQVRQNVIDDSLPLKHYWKLSAVPAPFKLNGQMKLGAQATAHGGRHRVGLTVYRNNHQTERSFLI